MAWTRLTGRRDGIDTIRRFGSRCFVQVPVQSRGPRPRSSFNIDQGASGIILGQETWSSGWVVRLDTTGEIVRSRDVYTTRMAAEQHSSPRVEVGDRAELTELGSSEVPDAFVNSSIDGEVEAVDGGGVQDTTHGGRHKVHRSARRAHQRSRDELDRQIDAGEDPYSGDLVEHELHVPQVASSSQVSKSTPPRPSWDYALVPERRLFEGIPVDLDAPRSTRGQPSAMLASELALTTVSDEIEPEPVTVRQARMRKDWPRWRDAMGAEIKSLVSKDTWREESLPVGRRTVGCKWVFKIKRNADGEIVKYKARLFAKGYSQVPGVDFEETYAPVGRMKSLRILLAIGNLEDWAIVQADVETA